MNDKNSRRASLHDATHRVPGVPVHSDQDPGHQGSVEHGRSMQASATKRRAPGRTGSIDTRNPARRPPRVLIAWQRRIAALFGQEV